MACIRRRHDVTTPSSRRAHGRADDMTRSMSTRVVTRVDRVTTRAPKRASAKTRVARNENTVTTMTMKRDSSSGGGDASSSSASASASASNDWRLETIAGRCAMVGYATLPTTETLYGGDAWTRASADVIAVGALVALVTWASTAPFEFNPQSEYDANPESLRDKKGISGFLAYEALNLNVDVERFHARLAMLAFALTTALERFVLHRGLWAS